MKALILNDKISFLLKNFVSFDIIEEIRIPRFLSEEDFEKLYKENRNKIRNVLKANVIFFGSNRFHHLTLFLLKEENPRNFLILDQHPDDFKLKENINSGSFVRYIRKLTKVKNIFYIGFLKPESKSFTDYILIDKDRKNFSDIFEFINSLPDKIYLSIDLDTLFYKDFLSFDNKYDFLLRKEEFEKIISELKDKVYKIDVCGFRETDKDKIKWVVKALNKSYLD